MTAWMVLTKRELVHRAARAGQFGPGRPWKPDSIPCPELPDASVICVVIVNQQKRPQLVAVLHDPQYVGKGYRGDSNTTPFSDITAKWFKLKFADAGDNNKFDPAATLRKPRPLTASDLKLLGIRAAGSPALPPLTCIATIDNPSIDDLDAVQTKQVETAGLGYDGHKLSAAQRLQISMMAAFSGLW